MKYTPILFSTPMVQAILEGRKSQTRRIVKPQPSDSWMQNTKQFSKDGSLFDSKGKKKFWLSDENSTKKDSEIYFPYGKIGDILWVRETLRQNGELGLEYVADNESIDEAIIPDTYNPYRNYAHCNIPNIHMPKWACRNFLKIKSVRVERLQDISEKDSESEGINIVDFNCYENYLVDKNWYYNEMNKKGFHMIEDPIGSFASLWAKINGDQSWNDNPWVWVIEFERINKPINFI